jgi:hypothetical protein
MANRITSADLQAFKQALLHDLVEIIEKNQPVTVRRWIKSADVLHLLDISPSTLRTLRKKRQIPFKRVEGTYRYDYLAVVNSLIPGIRPVTNYSNTGTLDLGVR